MKKSSLLMIIGIIAAVMPFLGFPNGIRTAFFVLFGLMVFFDGYNVRKKERAESGIVNVKTADSFVQNEVSRNETPRV